mmetsp:Transcript_14812/g.41686  ORF Transcript_14812/g.41686 Transcript_14812/m.41686 type:complete len:211 (+) Transcript_14812:491-1123(+)
MGCAALRGPPLADLLPHGTEPDRLSITAISTGTRGAVPPHLNGRLSGPTCSSISLHTPFFSRTNWTLSLTVLWITGFTTRHRPENIMGALTNQNSSRCPGYCRAMTSNSALSVPASRFRSPIPWRSTAAYSLRPGFDLRSTAASAPSIVKASSLRYSSMSSAKWFFARTTTSGFPSELLGWRNAFSAASCFGICDGATEPDPTTLRLHSR